MTSRNIKVLYATVLLGLLSFGVHSGIGAADDDLNLNDAQQTNPDSRDDAATGTRIQESDIISDDKPQQASILAEAWSAFDAGNVDESRKLLLELVAKTPSLPEPNLILAEFYLDARQPLQARALLEAAAEEDPTQPQMYLTFGKIALAENRLTEALMHFEKMEQLGPRQGWGEAEVAAFQATILSGKATVAERRQQWELAKGLLKELIRLQPKNAGLHQRLGKSLLLAGHEPQAIQQFELAYRADPTVSHPNAAVGALLVQTGDYDRANAHFAKALEQNPSDGPLNFAWSVALLHQDRRKQADTFARKAADSGLDTNRLLAHRGQISWSLGRFEEAERYFTKLLERSPDDAVGNYYLVLSIASQKNETQRIEALALAREFVANHPRSPAATAALGTAYFAAGKRKEAEDALAPIANHPELPPETLLLYGRALSSNGKRGEAQEVAHRLNDRIAQPEIFLTRAAAQEWTQSILSSP